MYVPQHLQVWWLTMLQADGTLKGLDSSGNVALLPLLLCHSSYAIEVTEPFCNHNVLPSVCQAA